VRQTRHIEACSVSHRTGLHSLLAPRTWTHGHERDNKRAEAHTDCMRAKHPLIACFWMRSTACCFVCSFVLSCFLNLLLLMVLLLLRQNQTKGAKHKCRNTRTNRSVHKRAASSSRKQCSRKRISRIVAAVRHAATVYLQRISHLGQGKIESNQSLLTFSSSRSIHARERYGKPAETRVAECAFTVMLAVM